MDAKELDSLWVTVALGIGVKREQDFKRDPYGWILEDRRRRELAREDAGMLASYSANVHRDVVQCVASKSEPHRVARAFLMHMDEIKARFSMGRASARPVNLQTNTFMMEEKWLAFRPYEMALWLLPFVAGSLEEIGVKPEALARELAAGTPAEEMQRFYVLSAAFGPYCEMTDTTGAKAETEHVFRQESPALWYIGWPGTGPIRVPHGEGFGRLRDIINAGAQGTPASRLAPTTERLEDGKQEGKASRIDASALEDAKENLSEVSEDLKKKLEDQVSSVPDKECQDLAAEKERLEKEIKRLSRGHSDKRKRPDETVRGAKKRAIDALKAIHAPAELIAHLEDHVSVGKTCRYTGGLDWRTK